MGMWGRMVEAAESTWTVLLLTEWALEHGAMGLREMWATVKLVHVRWWQSPAVWTRRTVELAEVWKLTVAVVNMVLEVLRSA